MRIHLSAAEIRLVRDALRSSLTLVGTRTYNDEPAPAAGMRMVHALVAKLERASPPVAADTVSKAKGAK